MKQYFQSMLIGSMMLTCISCTSLPTGDQSSLNPLTGMSEVSIVASGFISTEGPVWHRGTNSLLFSDIPGNTIYSLQTASGDLTTIRKPSRVANGLALDADGYLLAAEQETRIISRMNLATKEVTAFITDYTYKGQPRAFNSPNDMAIHPDGRVYFTDPPYGLRGRTRGLDFNGVFVRKNDGVVKLVKRLSETQNPNGIIFNPDDSILYLAVSDNDSGPIYAYDVAQDGSLSNEREFARAQNADGMAMDENGNLYVATRTGVRIWSAAGQEWGWIRLPDNIRTTNVAFAGEQMNTLYITNRSADLYAVTLNIKGHQ